jgi:hypothetical protein
MNTDTVYEYTTRALQELYDINELVDSIKGRVHAIPWSGLTRELFMIDFNLVVGKLSTGVEDGITLSQRVQHEIDEWLTLDQSNAEKYRGLKSQIGSINTKVVDGGQGSPTEMTRAELLEWWKTATSEERQAYLRSIYERVCKALGLTPIPLSFEDLPDEGGDTLGGFYDQEMKIRIDIDNIGTSSPTEMINAIAHETRHQFQNNCIKLFDQTGKLPDGVSPLQMAAWKLDQQPLYVSPEENAFLYWVQPVEVDARGFGEEFVNSMFGENSSGGGGGGGGGGAW